MVGPTISKAISYWRPNLAASRISTEPPTAWLRCRVGVWKSWVFAKPHAGDPSLEDFLGKDLLERFEPLNLEQLRWFERRSYFLNCNWKVFVDNYLDGGYHVPHIHGGLNSVLDYSNYTIETGERFCLQSSPVATDNGEAKTAAVRTGTRAYYYWIYPNFMINIYDGVMDTNLVIPRGVDKTEVIFDYYFADVSQRGTGKESRQYLGKRADPEPKTSPFASRSSADSTRAHIQPDAFRFAARPASIFSTGFCTPIYKEVFSRCRNIVFRGEHAKQISRAIRLPDSSHGRKSPTIYGRVDSGVHSALAILCHGNEQ